SYVPQLDWLGALAIEHLNLPCLMGQIEPRRNNRWRCASEAYACAGNPLFWGSITDLVAFLCFCRATIVRAKVRRVVYDHLTVPIRRISRFRHGAEVGLKSTDAITLHVVCVAATFIS